MDKNTKDQEKNPNPKPIFAQASGNTFLIFDYLDRYEHDFDEKYVRSCHREFGFEKIDSCLVLTKFRQEKEFSSQPSSQSQSSLLPPSSPNTSLVLRMYVYEPGDGFCGNGARVVSKYCFYHYGDRYKQFFIKSGDYFHELLHRDTESFVEMGKSRYYDPSLDEEFVRKGVLNKDGNLVVDGITWYYVNTSEPHLVTVDEINNEELAKIGNSLNDGTSKFPIGINLNRIKIVNDTTIHVQTFERGINRLTLACGTGSTSCVALAKRLKLIDQDASKVTVNVPGGYLIVSSENGRIYLGGPCSVDGQDKIE